ncbi:MAG: peptidase M16 [Coxiella sp. (in: Bacteria)]|nr:MAG: peptidase M16 [Coxiella sp. (in: g-proteobacteria)]
MKRALLLLIFLPILSFAAKTITQEYHLKNGLTVIVREDHRAPVVLASIWYRVGGSYEHDGITGISHMLEHMMFKGTKTYGPGVIVKMVTNNGGQQNAMTSNDFTAYYQMWAADKLPLSMKIESDRMRNLVLDQKLYDKEHQVVMEERRMRVDDSPQGLTSERFNAAAHVNNPYHHPVIGWMTDVKHLTLANLKQWYHQWYAPNNAVLVIVGDVNPKKVLYLAKKYFGSISSETLPTVKPRVGVAGLGERDIVVNIPAKLPALMMGYNVPELKTAKEAWQPYALDMLANVLSAGDSSRLQQGLVRGQQIAVAANASYDPFRLHDDLLVLSGTPASNHTTQQLKQAFLAEVKHLQDQPVSPAELERIKAQVIASNVFQKDSLMYQMYEIGIPEMAGLSWKLTRDYVANVSKVTPQQIQAVARLYLTSQNLTVATLKPKAERIGDNHHV